MPDSSAGASTAPGSSAATAAADSWVALTLPVTPDEAAAFTFTPSASVAAAASGPAAAALSAEAQDATATGGGSSSSSSSFGAAEARQQLLAWGADPEQATAAWVANHYRWIVWKLAAYDRKFMHGSSSSSSSVKGSGTATAAAAAAGCEGDEMAVDKAAAAISSAGEEEAAATPWVVKGKPMAAAAAAAQPADAWCLSVRNVMQQLQGRYTAEVGQSDMQQRLFILWPCRRLPDMFVSLLPSYALVLPVSEKVLCGIMM
jgi:hypothetical protein